MVFGVIEKGVRMFVQVIKRLYRDGVKQHQEKFIVNTDDLNEDNIIEAAILQACDGPETEIEVGRG